MGQEILVTGAAGFIGSHLCEYLLEQGHTVYGIDNFDPFYDRKIKERNIESFRNHERFGFFEVDLTDVDKLQRMPSFDVAVHLAGKAGVRPSIEAPQDYIDANITATLNVLELCRSKECSKIAFASSSSIYGNSKHIPFIEQGVEYEPISPYAFSKRSCELLNHTYHHLYNLNILNLRFFTVYGPRQRPDLAIHKFAKLLSRGESIPMFGDGSTSRDYTFVADTISGINGAITYLNENENVFEIINLGNNQPVKLSELIDGISAAFGIEPKIDQLPMQPGDVDITYASIDKAKKLFGYDPKTSIDEGLEKFVEWFRSR
ncbi:MAG: GDP-mannose 4,6-dehydratase [Flavobacteriales bacterium]|nr:GDP-mannose 4,6-dehydratase [Flavobacteriales bacterium]